jgi:hypothetical protein
MRTPTYSGICGRSGVDLGGGGGVDGHSRERGTDESGKARGEHFRVRAVMSTSRVSGLNLLWTRAHLVIYMRTDALT